MKYKNENGPYSYKYPMVSGAATLVIFKHLEKSTSGRILLIKRSMNSDSYPGSGQRDLELQHHQHWKFQHILGRRFNRRERNDSIE
jgi:hypothetical protein